MIRSAIPWGKFMCPGDELIFTCVTRGSQTTAWTSDEYVEPGTELDFGVFNIIGDTRTSPVNQSTVATLINNNNENGVVLLKSELRIACSIDNRNKKNISVQLLGKLECGRKGIFAMGLYIIVTTMAFKKKKFCSSS